MIVRLRRYLFTVIERMCRDRHQPGLRHSAFQCVQERQQIRRSLVMAKAAARRGRLKRAGLECAFLGVRPRIDEQHTLHVLHFLDQLRHELMNGTHLDAGHLPRLHDVCGSGADAIVAAEWIAASDDERVDGNHGSPSIAAQLLQQRAIGAAQLDVQRHPADGMGRAAQARIEGADAGLDAVQDRFRDRGALHVVLGDLGHGAVHREIVLPGGDKQIDFLEQSILIHVIVVEERAARRLADADAFKAIDARLGPQPLGLQLGVGEQ